MFRHLKVFYKSFCSEVKWQIIKILLISFLAGIFELIGIAAIIPVINVLATPDTLKYSVVGKFLGAFNCNSVFYVFVISLFFVLAIFLIKNAYMIYSQHVIYRFSTLLRNHICLKFMDRLFKCKYEFFLKKNSDSIINTIDNTIRYAIYPYLVYLEQLFTYSIITALLVLFIISKFFTPTIIVFLLCGLIYWLQNKFIKSSTEDINQNITKLNISNINILQKSIYSIKETKIWQAEQFVLKNFSEVSAKLNQLEQLGIFFQNFPSFIVESIVIIALCVFCTLVAYKQGISACLVEDLGLVTVVFFRLAPALNRLWTAIGVVKAHEGSLISLNKEYNELLSYVKNTTYSVYEKKRENKANITFSKSIKLKNVFFKYNNANNCMPFSLENISLEILKGEFIGIIGTSGAGKTTLVEILLGLLEIEKGEYLIDEELVHQEQLENLYPLFGYVAQFPYLASDTIANNIAFSQSKEYIDYARVKEVMRICQLDEIDPEYKILEFGKTFSGGQRQRIAIARALYRNPSLLILDEATSSLDISTESQIANIIEGLKKKVTIIAIAHRLSTLKACDKIIYMDKGKVVDVGTLTQLKTKHSNLLKMIQLTNIS